MPNGFHRNERTGNCIWCRGLVRTWEGWERRDLVVHKHCARAVETLGAGPRHGEGGPIRRSGGPLGAEP